jgi:hypothetical protein
MPARTTESAGPGANTSLQGSVPDNTVVSSMFAQYGVGFVADTVLSHGPICRDARTPCILGDGAGIVANFGVLLRRAWYVGGAYQLTRRDPAKLYRLATLQEARIELRRYQDSGKVLRAFAQLGLGASIYGDLWGADTYGAHAQVAVGAELELSRQTVLVLAIDYRVTGLAAFVDSTNSRRDAGGVQMFGLRIALEGRERL